ncbi:MAG: VOC family protein [Acidobacteria bacterium]|nr:VOC family protein [Acidobacteriota bacterium]MBI3424468.1 VOC family protein [Acidobacteriota bacterium]
MKLLGLKLSALLLCTLAVPVGAQQNKERNQPMPETPVIKKVGQIAVRVKDVARAVAFYRDKLGLKVLLQQPNLAVVECGGLNLFLTLPEKAEDAGHNSIIYFDVDDIQQTAKILTTHSVTIVEAPNKVGNLGAVEVWIAILRDSEDNLLGLRSMVPLKK